jgi:hypothetical protein
MEDIPTEMDSLLKSLAEWQEAQEIALGTFLTVG